MATATLYWLKHTARCFCVGDDERWRGGGDKERARGGEEHGGGWIEGGRDIHLLYDVI
jgi:hypothetical protein